VKLNGDVLVSVQVVHLQYQESTVCSLHLFKLLQPKVDGLIGVHIEIIGSKNDVSNTEDCTG
jgi:hypothetical protein